MGDGGREFKAKTKIVAGLLPPARHHLGLWQGVQRGVALHTVNMWGNAN